MHYHDMIKPIFEKFEEYYLKFYHDSRINSKIDVEKRARGAAFYQVLKDYLKQLYVESMVDQHVLDASDDEYLKYESDRIGYEIGNTINKEPQVFNEIITEDFIGKKIRKEVFVVILNKE